MPLRPADLEKRLRTLAKAKPIEWWRLVYDSAVALFIEGFTRQAGELWALTTGPDLPPPQALSRTNVFDEYLPPLVDFVITRDATLEAPAREADHWNRERLTVDAWALPEPEERADLPGAGPHGRIEVLQWYRRALSLLRPRHPGDRGRDPARGVAILQDLLDPVELDHYSWFNACLLVADQLIHAGREGEATAVLRLFFAHQRGHEYDALTLLTVAGLLARGALRGDTLDDAGADLFGDRLRALLAQRLAEQPEANPAKTRYRITTLHNMFFLEPREANPDYSGHFTNEAMERGYVMDGRAVAVMTPDETSSCTVTLQLGGPAVEGLHHRRFPLEVVDDLYLRGVGEGDALECRFAVPPGTYHVTVTFVSAKKRGPLSDWGVTVRLTPNAT